MYMCLWYGVLFVVSEGFNELCLEDSKLVALLAQPQLQLLRRFRHTVFHPSSYKDPRRQEMMAAGRKGWAWADSLTDAFAAYFSEIETADRAKRVTLPEGAS
jgi:hypothetical protein